MRELALLREVLDAATQRLAGPADVPVVERARVAIAQILTQAERVSLGGYRLVAERSATP